MPTSLYQKPKSIKIVDIWHDETICKDKNTNLPLDGKYEDEEGTIRYLKKGKYHNENGPSIIATDGFKAYWINNKRHRIDGPSVIYSDGDYTWWINGNFISKGRVNNWLKENDIPLDWNAWTDSDKMLFALHWSDYNG